MYKHGVNMQTPNIGITFLLINDLSINLKIKIKNKFNI